MLHAVVPNLPTKFPASFRSPRTEPLLDKRAQDRQYTKAMVNHFRQQLLTLEATGVTRVLSSDLQAMSDFVMSLEENEKAELRGWYRFELDRDDTRQSAAT